MTAPARQPERLAGLRRFAVAITVLNVLGHSVLGFEQPFLHPFVALLAAYATELALDRAEAWATGRPSRFTGPLQQRVDFFLSAHISALAVAMLLYANERSGAIAFAAVAAIASKALFRMEMEGGRRHFFNPSNLGITATLLLFPWVGIAPPYQFTENLHGWVDWVLPGVIVCTGSFLNARFTGRLPLIAAWLGGFVAQAALRAALFGTPLGAGLVPMTGVAFLLFTFYMVTDPATTPRAPRAQVAFGAGVAATYGVLTAAHVVFGLFFALTAVCAARALLIAARSWAAAAARVPAYEALPLRPEAVSLSGVER